MSRTLKGLRCHLVCELTSQPATVAWMLLEDRTLLGQKRRSFITHSSNNSHVIIIPQIPGPWGQCEEGPVTSAHTVCAVREEPRVFYNIVRQPALCSIDRRSLPSTDVTIANIHENIVQHRGQWGMIEETQRTPRRMVSRERDLSSFLFYCAMLILQRFKFALNDLYHNVCCVFLKSNHLK